MKISKKSMKNIYVKFMNALVSQPFCTSIYLGRKIYRTVNISKDESMFCPYINLDSNFLKRDI